jgi:hypothetical protein
LKQPPRRLGDDALVIPNFKILTDKESLPSGIAFLNAFGIAGGANASWLSTP